MNPSAAYLSLHAHFSRVCTNVRRCRRPLETLIQYHPGRGARHVPGQSEPDTWVSMDGSYKQYTFQNGMDLQAAVPLDAQALLTAAQQGAEVNEAEGWVRNLNSAALEQQLKTYQSQLKNYIDSQNGGQSTVGDVLGRPCKIHATAKAERSTPVFLALCAVVSAAANVASSADSGAKRPLSPRRTIARSSQRML